MKAFQPQVKVTLVKTRRRESLGTTVRDGQNVLPDMTRMGQFTELDLTPFLMDGGGVRTSKSVRDAAGTFSLTLNDRPVRGSSIYSLIEPMDIVEIRFARGPVARPSDLPVVMRGLVSAISRAETIEGGQPQRAVQVAGHDFGKILQMLRIYYLPGSVVGEVWLDEFKFFRQYNIDAKQMPASRFLEQIVDRVINPYLQKVVAITQGRGLSVAVPRSFTADGSIVGTVSPIGVAGFHGGSVHDLLTRFLDVGPFNELYVEDRGDSVAVVCRPAPWRDLAGDYIDPAASAETVEVSDEDLMQINVSRSDAGVANYYWCGSGSWELLNNGTLQLLAQSGPPNTYTSFDYINTDAKMYGQLRTRWLAIRRSWATRRCVVNWEAPTSSSSPRPMRVAFPAAPTWFAIGSTRRGGPCRRGSCGTLGWWRRTRFAAVRTGPCWSRWPSAARSTPRGVTKRGSMMVLRCAFRSLPLEL